MKLFNQTKIPDAILKPILTAAARRMRLKAKNIIVKIVPGRNGYSCSGVAKRGGAYYESFLSGSKSDEMVICNGFTEIKIPINSHPMADSLSIAQSFFKTACHEFKHIIDFHNRERFGDWNRQWKNRPHEIRAVDATNDALAKGLSPRLQESIIALGIAIDDELARLKANREKRKHLFRSI